MSAAFLLDQLIVSLENDLGVPHKSLEELKGGGQKGKGKEGGGKGKEGGGKKDAKEGAKKEGGGEKKEGGKGAKSEGGAGEGGDAKPKKEKKEKAAAAAVVPAAAAPAGDQPEFTKLEFKVGVLTKTWEHPESEKLFCEEIDVGEEQPRQVASGLRAFYTLAQFQPGRKIIVCTNLKPAKMAGFESQGMVLAASSADHSKVELVEVPEGAKVGERIMIEGCVGEPMAPNQVQKKKVLPAVLVDLKTDAQCVATWQGKPLMTSAGPLRVPTLANVSVG